MLTIWRLGPLLVSHFQKVDHSTFLLFLMRQHMQRLIFILFRQHQEILVQCYRMSSCYYSILCLVFFQSLMMQFYLQLSSSSVDQLHEQKFTLLLANASLNIVRAHLCSYASPIVRAQLLAHPSTCSAHFLTTFDICFDISHPTVPHFSRCQCGHTIDNLGIHLLYCFCGSEHISTHDTF